MQFWRRSGKFTFPAWWIFHRVGLSNHVILRLVPTNCMRACTAVITEISYNNCPMPYRAEIEFIDKADWAKELSILFEEVFDSAGHISRECQNKDSEAGVAYAKIKAVYPKLKKKMLEESNPEELMQHENVRVLGKIWELAERNNLIFHKKLQGIIDSREKTEEEYDEKDKKNKKRREPAYWP